MSSDAHQTLNMKRGAADDLGVPEGWDDEEPRRPGVAAASNPVVAMAAQQEAGTVERLYFELADARSVTEKHRSARANDPALAPATRPLPRAERWRSSQTTSTRRWGRLHRDAPAQRGSHAGRAQDAGRARERLILQSLCGVSPETVTWTCVVAGVGSRGAETRFCPHPDRAWRSGLGGAAQRQPAQIHHQGGGRMGQL